MQSIVPKSDTFCTEVLWEILRSTRALVHGAQISCTQPSVRTEKQNLLIQKLSFLLNCIGKFETSCSRPPISVRFAGKDHFFPTSWFPLWTKTKTKPLYLGNGIWTLCSHIYWVSTWTHKLGFPAKTRWESPAIKTLTGSSGVIQHPYPQIKAPLPLTCSWGLLLVFPKPQNWPGY